MFIKRIITITIVLLSSTLISSVAFSADLFSFKIYDTHAHLISPDTDTYPRAVSEGYAASIVNESEPGNTEEQGGQPVPGGESSVGERPIPEINSLLGWMAENGVEAAAAVQKKNTYGYDNSYILDSADQHGDKILPVVVMDAEDVNTDDLVEYWIKQRNLAGVRLSGAVSKDGTLPWLSSRQALKIWALADKYGLVVDLMVVPPGRCPPEFVAEVIRLAKEYKNAKIVLDHVAWPNAEGAPDYGIVSGHKAMAVQKNIYYKFTTINLDILMAESISSADMLRHLVDVYGADHIMWGSDIGNSAGKYVELVKMMVEATSKLTEPEKRSVMHDTGKRVFVGAGSGGKLE